MVYYPLSSLPQIVYPILIYRKSPEMASLSERVETRWIPQIASSLPGIVDDGYIADK